VEKAQKKRRRENIFISAGLWQAVDSWLRWLIVEKYFKG
jgi:hypothetical protein